MTLFNNHRLQYIALSFFIILFGCTKKAPIVSDSDDAPIIPKPKKPALLSSDAKLSVSKVLENETLTLSIAIKSAESPNSWTLTVTESTSEIPNYMSSINWSQSNKQKQGGLSFDIPRTKQGQTIYLYIKAEKSMFEPLFYSFTVKVAALDDLEITKLETSVYPVLQGNEILCAKANNTTMAVLSYDDEKQTLVMNISKDYPSQWQSHELHIEYMDGTIGRNSGKKEDFLDCHMEITGDNIIILTKHSLQLEKKISNKYLNYDASSDENQIMIAHQLLGEEQFTSLAGHQDLQNIHMSHNTMYLVISCEKENKIVRIDGFDQQSDLEPLNRKISESILEIGGLDQIMDVFPFKDASVQKDFIFYTHTHDFYWGTQKIKASLQDKESILANLYFNKEKYPELITYNSSKKVLKFYHYAIDSDLVKNSEDLENYEIPPMIWKDEKTYTLIDEEQTIIDLFGVDGQNFQAVVVGKKELQWFKFESDSVDIFTLENSDSVHLD